MCGIFGYIGPQNGVQFSLTGLKKLEYRGYDSAGIAGLHQGQVLCFKEEGKVEQMERSVCSSELPLMPAIAHTRWATHGNPSRENAHPHCDMNKSLALVHNGIVENYVGLKENLQEKGVVFTSETDSEVIAQLIGYHYKGDLLATVQQVLGMLQGAWAIALVHKDYPDQIIAAASESPLAIGVGNGETFIASDTSAFLVHTQEVCYLQNQEIAVVKADSMQVYDTTAEQVVKQTEMIESEGREVSKEGYDHFMLKEIHEQPQVIRNALLSRFTEQSCNASFDDLHMTTEELLAVDRIIILACGTSYHAGYTAAYMLENQARIPTQVEISSEFRYKNPIVQDNTLVIAISQSGETADTLAAMRELKSKGAKVVAICNVHGSTLTREADSTLFLRAGVEVSVCSTKAFVSQLVVLSLFALMMARMRNMSQKAGQQFLKELKELPEAVQSILDRSDEIEAIAKQYAGYDDMFFLGRQQMFPAALEGALKLKEISYVNANGYAAGEMKHGPIALVNPKCATVALCANELTYDKILSNIMEIKARLGPVVAVAAYGAKQIDKIADHVLWVPPVCDELAGIPTGVACQLFAYFVARARGIEEIDQPRNLAKSVTVE